MNLCNKCDSEHDTDHPLCPTFRQQWRARIDAAAKAYRGRIGDFGVMLAQDQINHDFKLGAYAPVREVKP
jgi:hypothetical protein